MSAAFKLIDERGIVVGLQPEIIDAISRELAQKRLKQMQKVFYIGEKYT